MATKTNHILVGLGGTGGKILRAFKMRMFEEFPDFEERKNKSVALLYVDSSEEMTGIGRADFNVMGKDASFTENEFLYIKGVDVPSILDNFSNYPQLSGIVDNVSAVRTAIGSLGEAAGQKRRAGRLLFAVNASRYCKALQNAFSECKEVSGNDSKIVHIFAGLCGGTGSGSIIDAILQTRKLWSSAIINVYVMMPEKDLPKSDMDKGRYYQNGYAAMCELNALQCGIWQPSDVTGNGEKINLFDPKIKGVANGISVYSNVNVNGRIVDSFEELPRIVSDYVYSRIFLINSEVRKCEDIIRAYNFENMDDFALESDETVSPSEIAHQEIPFVRTKKINSFGIKRVVYPEMRVLKHITYTEGKSVLNHFKFKNWREHLGYINEEENIDYKGKYFRDSEGKSIAPWMLDIEHLTLEKKVLPKDKEFKSFAEDWRNKINDFIDICRESDCPPKTLEQRVNEIFNSSFRGNGVKDFYNNQQRLIPEITKEFRKTAENDLFAKWMGGEVSIMELSRMGELLVDYISEDLKEKIENKKSSNITEIKKCTNNLEAILKDWNNVGFLGKFITKKKEDYYIEYQAELQAFYVAKTQAFGLEFAEQLLRSLTKEFISLSKEINEFSKLLSDAIKETDFLITSQRKINKGLEDMKGAVVEVSEEETLEEFEKELKNDQSSINKIASQMRAAIINTDFVGFDDLCTRITVDDIKKAFDVTLSKIIKQKHEDRPATETKVLGLNILSQLQQKLDTEEKIKKFAKEILEQSGAYLYLNDTQMKLAVRNNDLPEEGTNINLKETFISIPSPEGDSSLVAFAKQLEDAFKSQAKNGEKKPVVFAESPRKNELSIITISCCYPMRAITWMADYKKLYDSYLHTGNKNTDLGRSILLHSEGYGDQLPPIFAFSNDELKKLDNENKKETPMSVESIATTATPPPPPSVAPPLPNAEPQVQLFLYVGGQQYGPYDWNTCKKFVTTGQLTAQTLVWEQGMAAWTPAGQVAKLQLLFEPVPPTPQMPPMPPGGSPVPPPMN